MATLSQPSAPGLSPMFAPNPNGMGGGPPGPPYQYPTPHYHQQPAPRQRTAIACRYCRRRKIRCSGFETSPDGRCANCMRFNQECVFTPVSSQTQAFVPAHALVGGSRPPQLYGPQGQPLPPGYQPQSLEYHSHPPHYQLPSPGSHVNGDASPFIPQDADRNRGLTLPPPPAPQSNHYTRRGSAGEYTSHHYHHPPQAINQPPSPSSHLPPPHHGFSHLTQGVSPPNLPPVSQAPGGSYNQRPDSPGSARSASDHHSVSPQPQHALHPPMVRPTSTPPGQIPSMHIADLLDAPPPPLQGQPQHAPRHAADGDMLSRLNSRTGL